MDGSLGAVPRRLMLMLLVWRPTGKYNSVNMNTGAPYSRTVDAAQTSLTTRDSTHHLVSQQLPATTAVAQCWNLTTGCGRARGQRLHSQLYTYILGAINARLPAHGNVFNTRVPVRR